MIPREVYPDVCVPPGGNCGTPFTSGGWVDPSCTNVFVDGQPTDSFVVLVETAERVALSHYSSNSGFSTWSTIANPVSSPSSADVDKPWIVRGASNELHAVYMQTAAGEKYNFGRSTDGGTTWTFQPVSVPGIGVGSTFCAQPTVLDGLGCYLTVTDPGPLQTRLVYYSDLTSAFELLRDAAGDPVTIPQNGIALVGSIAGGYWCSSVPWPVGVAGVGGLLSIFVLRPDVVVTGADTHDVNLYCYRIQNTGTGGAWQITATWQFRAPGGELPDISGNYPDQFCHAAVIDEMGRLHVVFYDNTSTIGSDGLLRGDYDAWHIVVPSPATTPPLAPQMLATNLRTLPASEDPPLLLANAYPSASPREYSGIDTYFDAELGKTVVWCLYVGTSTSDDDANKTVLFASRILLGL